MWVKIHPLKNVQWLVGCCYRPEVAEEFMLKKNCKSIYDSVDTENFVLTGDFNFRGIDWKNLCAIRSIDNDFIDAILDNMLNQVVKEATREKNTLDLVFVGDASSVQAISVEENFGRSDHSVVYAEIQCPVPRIAYAKKKVYLYTKGEYDDLNDEIKTVVWSNILNSNNIETNWSG